MKITNEISTLQEFTPWSGATYNYNLIIQSGNDEAFIEYLEITYPEGIDETMLNDILWFEDSYCYQFINDDLLTPEELEIKKEYWR